MPPNFLRQVEKVASEMACLWQSSRAETPASDSRRILMIYSSEKLFFMGMSSCGL